MPLMKSLRRFRLASTTGHVINFSPNTPVDVPKAIVSEALAAGCAYVDPEGNLLDESAHDRDSSPVQTGFAPKLRESVLMLTMDAIRKHNRAADFNSGGVPMVEVVQRRSSIDTNAKEVANLWRTLQEATNEASGKELDLHPEAQKVLDVLGADGHADLDMLAEELGLKDKVAGMTVRDKRAYLLAHFNGSGTSE